MKTLDSFINEQLKSNDANLYADFEEWVTDTLEEWENEYGEYDPEDYEDRKGDQMFHAASWFKSELDTFNKKYHHNAKWDDTLEDMVEDIKQNYI